MVCLITKKIFAMIILSFLKFQKEKKNFFYYFLEQEKERKELKKKP
jgi:hypothetical protein